MAAGTAGVSVMINLPVTGWVDITGYVRLNDGGGINITAGCADETTAVGTSECSMVVDDPDGRFSIGNPNGAWWSQIALGVELRVTTTAVDGDSHDRFWGKIRRLAPRRDQTGTICHVELEASGESYFLKLNRHTFSPYKMMVMGSTLPVGYWPMEGPLAGTVAGYPAAIGVTPAALNGTVTPAEDTSVPGSGALPVISTGGSIAVTIPTYATNGTSVWRQVINVPAAGLGGTRTLVKLSLVGGTIAAIHLYTPGTSSFTLGVKGFNFSGTEVFSSPSLSFLASWRPSQVWMEMVQSGADINLNFGIAAVNSDGSITTSGYGVTVVSAQTMGRVVGAKIAPDADIDGMGAGHLAFGTDVAVAADGWAAAAYQGETAEDRISRWAIHTGVSIDAHTATFFPDDMGPQPTATFADILQDIADTNRGILCDATSQPGIDYFSRWHMHYSDVVLTLDVDSGHVRLPPKPTFDDKDAVFAAEASGARYESTKTTFGKIVSTSPNTARAAQDQAAAEWEVHLGEGAAMRLSSITIDLVGNTALRGPWLAIYPGDRVRVTTAPDDYPRSSDLDFILRGWNEFISYVDWDVTMNVTSADPQNVGLLETYGSRLDDAEAGTTVDGTHDSVDTTILIATSAPGMSTTGVPFDMLAGTGERFTVTTVTSHSATSYTLTVTRSVNGIIKSLPDDTAIWLAEPFILAR